MQLQSIGATPSLRSLQAPVEFGSMRKKLGLGALALGLAAGGVYFGFPDVAKQLTKRATTATTDVVDIASPSGRLTNAKANVLQNLKNLNEEVEGKNEGLKKHAIHYSAERQDLNRSLAKYIDRLLEEVAKKSHNEEIKRLLSGEGFSYADNDSREKAKQRMASLLALELIEQEAPTEDLLNPKNLYNRAVKDLVLPWVRAPHSDRLKPIFRQEGNLALP
jgi:hypothetical protein